MRKSVILNAGNIFLSVYKYNFILLLIALGLNSTEKVKSYYISFPCMTFYDTLYTMQVVATYADTAHERDIHQKLAF